MLRLSEMDCTRDSSGGLSDRKWQHGVGHNESGACERSADSSAGSHESQCRV